MSSIPMSNTALIAAAILSILMIAGLAIAWLYARKAYDEGLRDGKQESELTIYELGRGLARQQHAAEVSRHQGAEALEQQWLSHETELNNATSKAATLARENQQLQTENAELQKQAERQNRAIQLLQTAPPIPDLLTIRDVERITAMAEKLRGAAPALHATQQFKASKEAERLSRTGLDMAAKLRGALNAQAPAQDAAA